MSDSSLDLTQQVPAYDLTAGIVLEIEDLGVTYSTDKGPKEVLRGISVNVADGEFVCIVGPSGAGKTTLLRCIAGLMRPTAGRVLLDGEVITEPPARLALVSQDYTRSLMPWLRIAENVKLPLRGKGIDRAEIAERVSDALEAVYLTNVARHYPWQLSGGMQQRVSIARALAYKPEVLVMDEPFASVDAQTRAELEDLVLAIQREHGMTIVLVTHDVDESVYLADRVIVLGGTPASVRRKIPVHLGRQRDQLATKTLPAFIEHRTDVLASIRAARAECRQQELVA